MKWTRDEKVYLCGMHYISGLPLKEIAKDLKRNEDTVRSMLDYMIESGEYRDCVNQWLRES